MNSGVLHYSSLHKLSIFSYFCIDSGFSHFLFFFIYSNISMLVDMSLNSLVFIYFSLSLDFSVHVCVNTFIILPTSIIYSNVIISSPVAYNICLVSILLLSNPVFSFLLPQLYTYFFISYSVSPLLNDDIRKWKLHFIIYM